MEFSIFWPDRQDSSIKLMEVFQFQSKIAIKSLSNTYAVCTLQSGIGGGGNKLGGLARRLRANKRGVAISGGGLE